MLDYFGQTRHGESGLWSWVAGFWFLFLGWLITQNFIAGPIPSIVETADPELYQRYMDEMAAMVTTTTENAKGLAISGGIAFFTTIITTILCIIMWAAKSTRKIITPLAILGIMVTFYFGIKMSGLMGLEDMNAVMVEMMGVNALIYALFLLTFPAALIGLFLVQKFLHKRTLVSLHTAANQIDWMRIVYAIGVTWAVYAVMMIIMHFTGVSSLKMTFDPSRFFFFAIVTLIFIPLQSGTEEIIFRGYFNQGLGHFISNKWIVFIITSIAFAAMHLSNPESAAGAEAGATMHLMVMSSYFLFGFFMCLLVLFEDGLEAAIGVHAANNMFAAMFVNYEGSVLPTPSVFLATSNPSVDIPFGMAAMGLVVYLLYRSRKKLS